MLMGGLALYMQFQTKYENKMKTGNKLDQGKLPYTALTRSLALPLHEIVKVLDFGIKKYSKDNWLIVPNAKERYEDALDRHLASWRMGETKDTETNLHHLAHAGCCLLFVLYFELTGKGDEI